MIRRGCIFLTLLSTVEFLAAKEPLMVTLFQNSGSSKTSIERVIKKESHLTNVTASFNQTNYDFQRRHQQHEFPDESAFYSLTNHLFQTTPPLQFNVDGITSKCQKDGEIYLTELQNARLWALQMYDSNAKIPTGLLTGNVNQYGNFDECLAVRSLEHGIQGKYCLAEVQAETSRKTSRLGQVLHMMHSSYIFRSTLEDSNYPVAKLSSINWALCVPKSCTAKDVDLLLRQTISTITNEELIVDVKVDQYSCTVDEGWTMPWSTILVGLIFAIYVLYVLIISIYDSTWVLQDPIHQQFSLKRNFKELRSMDHQSGNMATVHGVRCFNSVSVNLAHKAMVSVSIGYLNRQDLLWLSRTQLGLCGRMGTLFTDVFFMLSGLLASYSLIGKLNKNQPIHVLQEYKSRLIRISPMLLAVYLFTTFINPWISNGPQWHQFATQNADICKEKWWPNVFFIQNLFPFEKSCLMQTHQLATDMQLFLVTPFLAWGLWRFRNKAVMVVVGLGVLSTILRYYVMYTKRLDVYFRYGISLKELFAVADQMYTKPQYRATVYLIGVLLGYFLRMTSQLKKGHMQIGNVIAIALFLYSWVIPTKMNDVEYTYQPDVAAWYGAVTAITWCLPFAWVIFIAERGYSNRLTRFFSWRGFIVYSRLSYGIYLVQFIVFYYSIGRVRTPEMVSLLNYVNLNELFCMVAVAVVFTLLFDMPFQNLKKLRDKNKKTILASGDNEISSVKKVE